MRFLGALVLILSIALLGFSIYALGAAKAMAGRLTVVGDAFGQQLDARDWQRHWVAASIINGLLAAIGVAAGFGLLTRRSAVSTRVQASPCQLTYARRPERTWSFAA